jgi:hypothetical protein
VSPLERQSQNASAGIASSAKEKDFHNRTSRLNSQSLALHGRASYRAEAPEDHGIVTVEANTR